MSANERSLIGSVFERPTPSTPSLPSSRFTGTPGTGFPAVPHRSKSAFARAREETKGNAGVRLSDVPSVVPTQVPRPPPVLDTKPIPTDTNALRRQISEENERKVAGMTEEEIEQEKQEILEQLGSGAGDLLTRIQEARQRKSEQEASIDAKKKSIEDDVSRQAIEHHIIQPKQVAPGLATRPGVLRVKSLENLGQTVSSRIPLTRSSTRPSSRTGRKLRFAEVTPNDVHVYESAPVSPKRTVFTLPPPPDTKDDSIVSLGTFNGDAVPMRRPHPADSPTFEKAVRHSTKDNTEPEEGTPEYIRRRYFPNIPANDPSLAWMESSSTEADHSAPRFDLHGTPIPASLSVTLPSHLGLHHHAEGSHAGYTIEDIFLLSRSTIPAQRASMLSVLAKIARRLGQQFRRPDFPEKIVEFSGKEGELRKRILATGLAAIDQIGSLGARAVEVVWECLVEWDRSTSDLEGVELMLAPDVVSSLQLDYFVPQVADVLSHAALPPESLAQLLAITHWLAQQSNELAEIIMNTVRLVPTILQTFVLTPIPPREESLLPNPLAVQLLTTLASASRSNASALLEPADALLRFVTLLPPSSPFPTALATSLLTHTLRFYTALASYGLYSHIATTASQYFFALGTYVFSTQTQDQSQIQDLKPSSSSSSSIQLRIAWASLVEAWIVCATDPHATSPPHEVLWSQVCGWGWAAEVRKLREGLGKGMSEWGVWAAVWSAEAAWLEGARVNGVKGGEGERKEALDVLAVGYKGGIEFEVVRSAVEAIQRALGGTRDEVQSSPKAVSTPAGVLSSALRLWLACLPPPSEGTSLSSPPFLLPFNDLSTLCAILVKHPIWSLPSASGAYLQVHLRPLTGLLVHFHRISRYIPGTTPQLWLAQDLAFLPRLLPGDEAHAFAMLDALSLIAPHFAGIQPHQVPEGITINILRPFFEHTIRPDQTVYIAPLHPSPESIAKSTTLRLPGLSTTEGTGAVGAGEGKQKPKTGHPLPRDWLTSPLTHLLRSGTSPVFRALPASWTASEVDVVRATLLLLFVARRVLLDHGLGEFVLGPAEVVFACMRVCMLEHGVVGAGAGAGVEEVFRDGVVERLMGWLLAPYTRSAPSASPTSTSTSTPQAQPTTASASPLPAPTAQSCLELASRPYLQPTGTPFYQFYTDLVALYTAVSFAHPGFAALLLTPLAMRYAGDYRRVLWCESGDGGGVVVRWATVGVEGVVCAGLGWEGWDGDVSRVGEADIREYLYPAERDGRLLGAYVQSLTSAQGFLRLVAVHHIACAIWADLQVQVPASTRRAGDVDVAAKLLRVLLSRGDGGAVHAVLLYRQSPRGAFVWPPACYEGGGDDGVSGGDTLSGWRAERLEFVRGALGDEPAERVEAVFRRNQK